MKADWIAYVGHFLFPWGQAASRRVYGNAMSLVDAGYNVMVASGSDQPQNLTRLEGAEGGCGLSHIGLGACPDQKVSQLQKAIRLLFSSSERTIQWLDKQPTKPSHVVLYGGYTPYMLRLLPWCRRNNVNLIADIVEWYEPILLTGGIFGLSNINATIAMRHLFPKCDGIIAISSFLANYYRERGCSVLRVPPTLELSHVPASNCENKPDPKPLTLIYAGTPGKKDLLANVIRGIMLADPPGELVRLLVLGPDVDQICSLLGSEHLPSFVQVLGRVEQSEVAKIYQSADFSVLLREPLRFAQAGFPTKFVESMALGIPVIANITSDLGEYLHDGIEGVVADDYSAQAFAHALGRALRMTPQELVRMRHAARHQAECSFDFRNYTAPLGEFIEMVRR